MKTVRPLGLYIHIPFCKAKCVYCDFYSLPHGEDRMDAYTDALCAHLTEAAPLAASHTVDTVYFGGGTPSYLGEKRLCKILKVIEKCYQVARDAEITLEANPDSAGDWKALRALRRCGFNRISLGMQSACDEELRTIGRVHTMEQVQQAVEAARKAKIQNLSLDLIYGLPHQTQERWMENLAAAVALNPEHLSCYGLKVEEGTPLFAMKDTAGLPGDEEQADMYLQTVEFLKQYGYEQYEISNFAKPGRESRHNLKYWKLQEYAGFGPGAHSDFGGVRYAYEKDLDAYIAAAHGGQFRFSENTVIPPRDRDVEWVMLGSRTVYGLDPKEYENRFRRRFDPIFLPFLQKCEAAGYAVALSNDAVREYGLAHPGFERMGTTLVSAVVRDDLALVSNVGDSRAYHITREGIRQVSRDHSVVEDMVEKGDLTRDEARHHPRRNLITRALGTEPGVAADAFPLKWQQGDFLLLCSDGLINTVSDQELLFEVIHSEPLDTCLDRLLALSRQRGAPDNVTAVLLMNI